MATLPPYKPTARSFLPASHPVVKRRTVSGRTIRIIKGRFPSQGSMNLEYGGEAGLLDSEAAEFREIWLESSGVVEPLILPDEVFAGMSTKLRSAFQDNLVWAFSKTPPVIQPTIPGRSTVSLTLEHRLNAGLV